MMIQNFLYIMYNLIINLYDENFKMNLLINLTIYFERGAVLIIEKQIKSQFLDGGFKIMVVYNEFSCN